MVDELPDWYVAKMQAAKYMATVQLILKLKQPMSHIYWMNIADRSIRSSRRSMQTNYIPPETYNGKRVLYISTISTSPAPITR